MGYYDGTQLNFLYYMATNFATSDRFFMPAMSRTNINREYLLGATSGGYAYPNGTTASDTPQLKSMTIFEDLQNAGITWRIYVDPLGTGCNAPYTAACLVKTSYLGNFTYAQTIVSNYPQNIQPISQYLTDVQNGTLAQVSEIEPPSDAGLDEHGTDADKDAPTNIEAGEAWVESLITPLMSSRHPFTAIPGAGDRLVNSCTSAATWAAFSSLGLDITQSIQAAICFISVGPMPRLVTEGEPSRMPDGSNGLRVS